MKIRFFDKKTGKGAAKKLIKCWAIFLFSFANRNGSEDNSVDHEKEISYEDWDDLRQ